MTLASKSYGVRIVLTDLDSSTEIICSDIDDETAADLLGLLGRFEYTMTTRKDDGGVNEIHHRPFPGIPDGNDTP